MLESRSVEDHESLCPAAAAVGETISGSGCLCRITGSVITTGENPSSLVKFCWNRWPDAGAADSDGNEIRHGYMNCPPWRHNRELELEKRRAEFVTPD